MATSAKAAEVLGDQLGERAENLHKFLFELQRPGGPVDAWYALRAGDVVLVDEAGMAGTMQLARLLECATAAGASLRLLGDPAQLASVDAGGALRLLEREVGATYLTDLHRFTDPDEGRASLMLREGDLDALSFYVHRDRIRTGSTNSMLERAYAAWATDDRSGVHSVLIAATNEDVTALNARARRDRVELRSVRPEGVVLRDGNLAGVGDRVVSRENARLLRHGRGRWVHNGDTWHVVRRHADGGLTLRHTDHKSTVRLPAEYVAESLELAYASTAHRVQGMTTESAHALVTPEMTREALYVASTRGRAGTTWYVATHPDPDVSCDHEPETPRTAREVLTAVLNRTVAEGSATEALRATQQHATCLPELVRRYEHARTFAAMESLRHAASTLPLPVQARVLSGDGSAYLAEELASAASAGADPCLTLQEAHELEPLDDARSPALVLASRIQALHGRRPVKTPAAPLPWLPEPNVGHPGWLPYLEERAALIGRRLEELGSLTDAYREQYDVTGPIGLGDPPEPGTRQADAYEIALSKQAAVESALLKAAAADIGAPVSRPTPPVTTRRQGPRLSL